MKTVRSYKIAKNVPLPAGGRGTGSKYPLERMAIGDSFFVRGKTTNSLSGCIKSRAQIVCPKRKFTLRIEGKGVRVWRIE